jgi:hypothetical protein
MKFPLTSEVFDKYSFIKGFLPQIEYQIEMGALIIAQRVRHAVAKNGTVCC